MRRPPIILFVYARPTHTRRALAALAANAGAQESELIVFADGARSVHDAGRVQEVRAAVRSQTGFKSVRLVERSANLGLAKNIITGLNEVFSLHESAIVLEDDIQCEPGFLNFMAWALAKYAGEPRIWHVNGWNFPIALDRLPSVYCVSTMSCWGWGTWADRWRQCTFDPAYFMRRWSIKQKYRFNLEGSYPFYSHLLSNYVGRRHTWAIFWYATIFDAHGLCLQTARTLTAETGSDGSGTHGLVTDMYMGRQLDVAEGIVVGDVNVEENALARARVVDFCRSNFGVGFRLVNALRIVLPGWLYTLQRMARHG